MYYWLKYDEDSEERYVISDSDEVVYLVYINDLGQLIAYKQKMLKHQLIRFKPYFEVEKTSKDFEVDVIK
jgi:hypothetical protein